MIGESRVFQGSIRDEGEQESDADYLKDIRRAYDDGDNLIHWTDGSVQVGTLGAGVAWEGEDMSGCMSWETKAIPLGQDTGSSTDAELYAIKAALELAEGRIWGAPWIRHVWIFSDCLGVLQGLKSGKIIDLGPAIPPSWALKDVYDLTDRLIGKKVTVELVWVKAHAESTGNQRADAAADRAVRSQPMPEGRDLTRRSEVPSFVKEMGKDAEDEWLYRSNKRWFDEGGEEEEEEIPPSPPGPRPPPPPSTPYPYPSTSFFPRPLPTQYPFSYLPPPPPPSSFFPFPFSHPTPSSSFIPPPPPGSPPPQPPPPSTPHPSLLHTPLPAPQHPPSPESEGSDEMDLSDGSSVS